MEANTIAVSCAAVLGWIVRLFPFATLQHTSRVSVMPRPMDLYALIEAVNEQELTVPTVASVRAVPASDAAALCTTQPVPSRRSEPGEVTVGPSGISNRYKSRHVDRRKETVHDVLIVSLHVESLATEGLISPFESGMFEISSPDMPPIKPSTPFRSPVLSGSSRD